MRLSPIQITLMSREMLKVDGRMDRDNEESAMDMTITHIQDTHSG